MVGGSGFEGACALREQPGLQLLIDGCQRFHPGLDSRPDALFLYLEVYSLLGLHVLLERLAVQCGEWDRLCSGLRGQALGRA